MLLYPKKYINRITDIDLQFLKENNIKGLILDVDNTLIDIDKKFIEGLDSWASKMIDNGIILYIVSNSNKKNKAKKVADKMDIPFENIGVVGDQIFTDVLGANRLKMYSILVEPISEKDIWVTRFNRKFEKIIKKKISK